MIEINQKVYSITLKEIREKFGIKEVPIDVKVASDKKDHYLLIEVITDDENEEPLPEEQICTKGECGGQLVTKDGILHCEKCHQTYVPYGEKEKEEDKEE